MNSIIFVEFVCSDHGGHPLEPLSGPRSMEIRNPRECRIAICASLMQLDDFLVVRAAALAATWIAIEKMCMFL